jgi:hypothetical protein
MWIGAVLPDIAAQSIRKHDKPFTAKILCVPLKGVSKRISAVSMMVIAVSMIGAGLFSPSPDPRIIPVNQ